MWKSRLASGGPLWQEDRGQETQREPRAHAESQRWAGAVSAATGPGRLASGTPRGPSPALLLLWRGGQGSGQGGEGASGLDQRGGSVA